MATISLGVLGLLGTMLAVTDELAGAKSQLLRLCLSDRQADSATS
jgi:hypothetical protein